MSAEYAHEGEPPYIVLIGVPDSQGLQDVIKYLKDNEIPHVAFEDNDFDFKIGVVVTLPLREEQRELLRHYPLWRTPESSQ